MREQSIFKVSNVGIKRNEVENSLGESEGFHEAFNTSSPASGKAAGTPGPRLAREMCFKEVDTELGMDHDGSRNPLSGTSPCSPCVYRTAAFFGARKSGWENNAPSIPVSQL